MIVVVVCNLQRGARRCTMTLTHCSTDPLLQMKIKPHTELFLAALPEVSMRPPCPSVLDVAMAKAELSDGEASDVRPSPLNLGLVYCLFLSCPNQISDRHDSDCIGWFIQKTVAIPINCFVGCWLLAVWDGRKYSTHCSHVCIWLPYPADPSFLTPDFLIPE